MMSMTDQNPRRAATTPASTPGSYAPRAHSAPEGSLGAPDIVQARILVQNLHPGASVIITLDGREYPCIVQRRGTEMGHPDHQSVTVGYGPGRWNQEVTPAGLAGGHYKLRPETNWERLQREAQNTDPTHPDFNSDMDITVPGIPKTYRDLINAGIDPNNPGAVEAFVMAELGLDG